MCAGLYVVFFSLFCFQQVMRLRFFIDIGLPVLYSYVRCLVCQWCTKNERWERYSALFIVFVCSIVVFCTLARTDSTWSRVLAFEQYERAELVWRETVLTADFYLFILLSLSLHISLLSSTSSYLTMWARVSVPCFHIRSYASHIEAYMVSDRR